MEEPVVDDLLSGREEIATGGRSLFAEDDVDKSASRSASDLLGYNAVAVHG